MPDVPSHCSAGGVQRGVFAVINTCDFNISTFELTDVTNDSLCIIQNHQNGTGTKALDSSVVFFYRVLVTLSSI